ncbi:MAG: 6,7-dimethyl-8-ribityllumazine synthase [Proteobacteria bacterium]|jgi:6,7-dimethyl-8-ribityllumazine synthase|nr:6,7-dimethyl-8-ribityllumazine synthase [Pseudomonadota bacterium]MBP10488.1 6,7-dimethyl-8-ribityllumazine synthase [Acidiferrobacteraceae bacterium]MDP6136386.1 6,7-dimethyl-8-ribityllumazine synthase [Arenicellales bacterium]HCF72405.1 6,7-dimethyl-8-ribityllumazine synthase [Gammaproteobacteria bacterium]MDP6392888.1 6,7-dimethyl-8-ribityllumazine synthase [Arenicellales bacterium]|tara:strand:+ start:8191 stop:8601 length:411 start_codon:yes stop_codon:yes gene_type:complete
MNRRHQIAIVIGSFHRSEGETMLSEALSTAEENDLEAIEQVWVPGTMEKPLAVKRLLLRQEVDGVAVLGVIERGETAHGRVMAQAVIKAIVDLQLETMKPVGVGILGPEILPDQIQSRLRPYARHAVLAVRSMLCV